MSSTQGVSAVIFDWAGTLVDFGSLAPMGAFVELFARHGVSIGIPEARVPMGLPKRAHVQALAAQPRIAGAWHNAHRRAFNESDLEQLYREFLPMSVAAAIERAVPIPGAVEAVAELRAKGIAVGSTTGYTRSIMEGVIAGAAQHGLQVDSVVCTDDVAEGRPSPFGVYQCMMNLGVWPARGVIKVDDTVPGLLEGRHAGCWTVAIAASGNAAGVSLEEWSGLDAAGRESVRSAAQVVLAEAAPHWVIDSVADLAPLLEQIEVAIRRGDMP